MELTKRSHWTWRQFFICFGISAGMLAFAYPAAVIATTLGQPTFLVYMELLTAEGTLSPRANSLIGAMSGVFQVRCHSTQAFWSLILTDLFSGRWRDWYPSPCSCQRQMGTKSRHVVLCCARPRRRSFPMCCTERWHVHCLPFLGRRWRVGFLIHQYAPSGSPWIKT